MVKRPFSHSAVFLFIPVNTWSLKLAMTFSLLYLPSFRGPAQTPGWIHFPLNYQNRAESDRKKCVEESSVPRPLHKGICPPIYARAWGLWGDWNGTSCPLHQHSFPTKQQYCPLCSHTIRTRWSSQWGMTEKTPRQKYPILPYWSQGPESTLVWGASACGPFKEEILWESAATPSKF